MLFKMFIKNTFDFSLFNSVFFLRRNLISSFFFNSGGIVPFASLGENENPPTGFSFEGWTKQIYRYSDLTVLVATNWAFTICFFFYILYFKSITFFPMQPFYLHYMQTWINGVGRGLGAKTRSPQSLGAHNGR